MNSIEIPSSPNTRTQPTVNWEPIEQSVNLPIDWLKGWFALFGDAFVKSECGRITKKGSNEIQRIFQSLPRNSSPIWKIEKAFFRVLMRHFRSEQMCEGIDTPMLFQEQRKIHLLTLHIFAYLQSHHGAIDKIEDYFGKIEVLTSFPDRYQSFVVKAIKDNAETIFSQKSDAELWIDALRVCFSQGIYSIHGDEHTVYDDRRVSLAINSLFIHLSTLVKTFQEPLSIENLQDTMLTPEILFYHLSIREQISHDNIPSQPIVVYGYANRDIVHPLITFRPSQLVMLDLYSYSIENLKSFLNPDYLSQYLKEKPDHEESYLADKVCHSAFDARHPAELKIVLELLALGVDLTTVKVEKEPGYDGFSLSFSWRYPGLSFQNTLIIFSKTVPRLYDRFPKGLKILLKMEESKIPSTGIDIYFEKNLSPVMEQKDYLSTMVNALKVKGHLILPLRNSLESSELKKYEKDLTKIEPLPLSGKWRDYLLHQPESNLNDWPELHIIQKKH